MIDKILREFKSWRNSEIKLNSYSAGNYTVSFELDRESIRVTDFTERNSLSLLIPIRDMKKINSYLTGILEEK